MAYMKIIEETTTWTCPKTADYEVICVAGGEGGCGGNNQGAVPGMLGTATSFGTFLTASGVWGVNAGNNSGGWGGYTLYAYGGFGGGEGGSYSTTSPSGNGGGAQTTGMGYGAGGGGASDYAGGRCGILKTTFVTITENTVVNCVIGSGGDVSTDIVSNRIGKPGANGVIVIREV